MRISYWSSGLCSSDLRIFVALDPARQGHELARTVGLGELARAPAGIAALAIGDDPDLEQRRFLILEVELAVRHAGAGAHHLDVARRGAAGIAHAVAVADRAGANIGDDFHVAVRVRGETRLRRDGIVVPAAQRTR